MSIFNPKFLKNWEYWPSYMFYVPLLPYAFYLAIKAKSFGFFSAVNPSIEGSGNGLESKYKTIKLLPRKYKPKSVFVKKQETIENILNELKIEQIRYPLIIKPDIGFRGLLVKKIDSEKSLISYLNKFNSINLIIQEFIDFKNECGIFYHRIPGTKKGKITSITLKKYLSVFGDGKSTLKTLIKENDRAQKYIDLILELNSDKLEFIPLKNEEVVLNVIGNHSKGTQFINGNHLISRDLENTFDFINSEITGWYYGRLDLKYKSFDDLLKGENFKILEINGVIAEPTHVYDSLSGSYFSALKTIKQHWKTIFEIGTKNNELNNVPYSDFKNLIDVYFRYKNYIKKVKKLTVI